MFSGVIASGNQSQSQVGSWRAAGVGPTPAPWACAWHYSAGPYLPPKMHTVFTTSSLHLLKHSACCTFKLLINYSHSLPCTLNWLKFQVSLVQNFKKIILSVLYFSFSSLKGTRGLIWKWNSVPYLKWALWSKSQVFLLGVLVSSYASRCAWPDNSLWVTGSSPGTPVRLPTQWWMFKKMPESFTLFSFAWN